jgi:hypothetical protein
MKDRSSIVKDMTHSANMAFKFPGAQITAPGRVPRGFNAEQLQKNGQSCEFTDKKAEYIPCSIARFWLTCIQILSFPSGSCY